MTEDSCARLCLLKATYMTLINHNDCYTKVTIIPVYHNSRYLVLDIGHLGITVILVIIRPCPQYEFFVLVTMMKFWLSLTLETCKNRKQNTEQNRTRKFQIFTEQNRTRTPKIFFDRTQNRTEHKILRVLSSLLAKPR